MLRAISLLTLLTLIWGFNWPVLKLGVTTLPPLWFRTIGLVLGTLLLGAILLLRRTSLRLPRGTLANIVLLALPNVVVWYAVVTIAMTRLPAGRAAILGFTMPVWSAIIGALFYREPLGVRVGMGVACALAGIALLVAGDWTALAGHPTGVALMLFAAAAWAWGTHLFKRIAVPLETLALSFWMFALSCPVLLAGSALFEHDGWRVPSGGEWWPIAYNAILVIAVGNAIWFTVARALPATTAGLSSMLIPVVGVFSSVVALGEVPSWRDYVALALICLAMALALWPASRTGPLRKSRPAHNETGLEPPE